MIRLVLPFPPSENAMYIPSSAVPKQGARKGQRVHFFRLSPEGRAWKDEATELLRDAREGGAMGEPLDRPVSVRVSHYFPTMAGDLTNRRKAILDVLQGFAYENDRLIWHYEEERLLGKGNQQRSQIIIEPHTPRVLTVREELEQWKARALAAEARLAEQSAA